MNGKELKSGQTISSMKVATNLSCTIDKSVKKPSNPMSFVTICDYNNITTFLDLLLSGRYYNCDHLVFDCIDILLFVMNYS